MISVINTTGELGKSEVYLFICGLELLSRYSDSLRGSNLGGGETFRVHQDWFWGPPILLYSWYRVYFPGVKRPGRGVNKPCTPI